MMVVTGMRVIRAIKAKKTILWMKRMTTTSKMVNLVMMIYRVDQDKTSLEGGNPIATNNKRRATQVRNQSVPTLTYTGYEDIDKEFEPRRWQWAYPVIEGVNPCPRGGHSATLSGTSIIIFGGHYYSGKQEGYTYLNDTYVLDVNANKFNVQ